MRATTASLLLAPLLAFAAYRLLRPSPVRLPPHLLGHPVRFFPALLSPTTRAELMNLTRALGELPCVASAEAGYAMTHEHIGEGLDHPAAPDGTCAHPFLVPSASRALCVLPGRVDVGRHYVATGGFEGLKEQHAQLVNRVQSFIRYVFAPLEHPELARLFADPGFLAAARSVCPRHAPVLDPFQTTLIAQVPGQTVPAHLDGVWFWGAHRFHVPQWLLAVMQFSGLFQARLVPQVQLVAYFHEWEDPRGSRGGQFVHWGEAGAPPAHTAPAPGSGSAMDGSRTVHAARLFEPAAAAPALDKSARHALRYAGGGRWALESDGVARGGAGWGEEELRFSVVYRARCFGSEAERAAFGEALRGGGEGLLELEGGILAPLVEEAARRGGAGTAAELWALPRLELALRLVRVFVRYPGVGVGGVLPVNYCALPKLFPRAAWLARAVDWLCPLR